MLETTSTAKSSAMGLEGEASSPACGRRNVGGRTVPGAATDGPHHALFVRTLRISIRRMLIVFSVVPVRDPLSDIAGHILDTVRRVAAGHGAHRVQGLLVLPFSIKVRALRRRWFIPPRVDTAIGPTSCLLPFCFRRQALLRPCALSLGVVPGHLHHG